MQWKLEMVALFTDTGSRLTSLIENFKSCISYGIITIADLTAWIRTTKGMKLCLRSLTAQPTMLLMTFSRRMSRIMENSIGWTAIGKSQRRPPISSNRTQSNIQSALKNIYHWELYTYCPWLLMGRQWYGSWHKQPQKEQPKDCSWWDSSWLPMKPYPNIVSYSSLVHYSNFVSTSMLPALPFSSSKGVRVWPMT